MRRAAARGSAALQALVEGDASRIEGDYVDELSDGDRREYERWKLDTASTVEGELEGNAVPSALVALFQSPYVLGAPMLRVLIAENDPDAVDELFRRPPRADVTYLEPRTLVDGFDGVDVATPALAEGETQSGKPDVFGAFALYLTLAAAGDPVRALAVADGWGGDAMVTFTRPDGTTCVRATFAGRNARAGADIHEALTTWAAGNAGAGVVADGPRTTLTACDPGTAAVDPGVTVDAALVAAVLRSELLAQGAEIVGLDASACAIDEAMADPTFAPVLAAAADDPSALPDPSIRVTVPAPVRRHHRGVHEPLRASDDEVLRLGVGDDDRRGALLGLELELLGELHADAVQLEQVVELGLVLEVGARRVAPRVARPAVLLAEQPGERRAVLVGEAPLLADAAVPQLGERLGHLDREAVGEEVVLVAVGGEQLPLALAGAARPR